MAKINTLVKFLESQDYQKGFKTLMSCLSEKYGTELFDNCGIGKQLDIGKQSKKFFGEVRTADTSVDPNANVSDHSVISHTIEMAKPFHLINSYYRMWKELKKDVSEEYANRMVESQLTGRIYVNDFAGWSSSKPYCYNYSTFDTALLGIPDAFDGRGGSVAPKNLMSFCGQIELFSLMAGNSTLGATGLADLLVTVSIFVDKMLQTGEDAHFPLVDEKAIWQYTESLLTGLIYRFNQPYRGSQSLFVNLSIYDSDFLDSMLDGDAYQLEIDGVVYKAKKEVIQKLQVLYLDIMNREMERKPLTFPVTTACFSIDDNKDIIDHSFLNLISEKNLKFGFINIYCGKSSTLSSCCRLRSDKSGEWFSSLGSSSSKIGSLGVATGNLPHLAFTCIKEAETRDEAREKFLLDVEELVRDCQCINNAKRNIIKRTIKTGTLPMYSLGYISLKTQYSTFGVIGLNEALEILGLDIKKKDGQDFALRMLNIINSTNDELQKIYKAPHNCEQIPGEGTACTLPVRDKLLGLNDKYDMYSNQFIPLVERVNMFDRIRMQGLFDKHFSGGAICHLNMDQDVQSAEVFKNLIIASAKEGVVYFAINLVLQECDNHHMTVGRRETCPVCGEPITGTYTRVVGFLSKVNNWVPTRREKDFPNRQFYKEVETK